ncbi:MAG: threonylcarbamoyl-AMP synthase [Gemmatimonadota bacterium]|nr:MAG: threonylcarbamoyl-AMP synthase [Gemmatimonadota bacterium]
MTVVAFRTGTEVEVAIPLALQHLREGGLLAHPTETIYGIGSRAAEPELAALARLKGRGEEKPFLLLVSSREMALWYGLMFNNAAQALADRFWPGPVTLVLPGAEARLPEALRGPNGGIAVRWTSHAATATLIDRLDEPITSTSANQPGRSTAPGVGAILDMFGESVASGELLVLDGGVLGNVPPSTLIDCTSPEPRLIREGAIPLTEIRAGVGRLAP